MKKILAIATMMVSIATAMTAKAESVDFYNQLSEDLDIIRVYETDELDSDILTNRNGNIVIEKTIGKVLNDDGDGIILNTDDETYNYISYRSVDGATTEDVILTYFIYNPDSNEEDDILMRFDYIIDHFE